MQLQPIGNAPQAMRLSESAPAEQSAAPAKPATPTALDKPAAQEVGAARAASPKDEQVTDAVKNINKAMHDMGQKLEFAVDEESNRTIVKVVDERTREVIRQMPSQEALDIAKALDRLQGLLIRQTA